MRNSIGLRLNKIIEKKGKKHVKNSKEYSEFFKNLENENLIAEHSKLKEAFKEKDIPKAMALFKEVSYRTNGLYPYDVQLLASYILYKGAVAEMKTGEGKTLVALITSYFSFLSSQKVHVVTVNDYLASRDAEFAKNTFDFLKIKIGFAPNDNIDNYQKREIYENSDIIYASNSGIGFDYLRSNIVKNWNEKIIKNINDCFAIVDEVDSVLIDEAKNPLIISGEADSIDNNLLHAILDIVKDLKGITIDKDNDNRTSLQKMTESENDKNNKYDYIADKKIKKATLTEKGYRNFEEKLIEHGLIENVTELYKEKISYTHIAETCLSAISVYANGVDYIIGLNKEGNKTVKLIDSGTGRVMEGRMLNGGMHQAIEAKEGLDISTESINLAEITYQNLFKLYGKLSGMTGTAYEDKSEFEDIYNLTVCRIPTRLPLIRKDAEDIFFPDKETKIRHTINKIIETHEKQQPILVGTNSVNDSEEIAKLLAEKNIKCEVLNAKNHERESEIIAQAGRLGAITIATSMAGRGTDILLGGNVEHLVYNLKSEEKDKVREKHYIEKEKVKKLGGLFVLGFERNKSRRVDDQLKGRSGRQGDPGESMFFISLEDDLMSMYADNKRLGFIRNLMFSSGNETISDFKMLSKVIHKSQRKASDHEFTNRLSLLKFDNVIDTQRKKFYSMRDELMLMPVGHINLENGRFLSPLINSLESEFIYHIESISKDFEKACYGSSHSEEFPIYQEKVMETIGLDVEYSDFNKKLEYSHSNKSIGNTFFDTVVDKMNEKKDEITNFIFYSLLKNEKLNVLDRMWVDILESSSEIKRSIHLRGYAQKKPEDEYKKETWKMFNKNILHSSTITSMKNIFNN